MPLTCAWLTGAHGAALAPGPRAHFSVHAVPLRGNPAAGAPPPMPPFPFGSGESGAGSGTEAEAAVAAAAGGAVTAEGGHAARAMRVQHTFSAGVGGGGGGGMHMGGASRCHSPIFERHFRAPDLASPCQYAHHAHRANLRTVSCCAGAGAPSGGVTVVTVDGMGGMGGEGAGMAAFQDWVRQTLAIQKGTRVLISRHGIR